MRAYKYTGEDPLGEVFPELVFADVDADGVATYRTAVLTPGDTFTTDTAVDHPRLGPAGRAHKDMPHATVRVEEFPDTETAAEAADEEPAGPPAPTEE